MQRLKQYIKELNSKNATTIVFILIFTVIGVYYLSGSHASGPYTSEEAEAGGLTFPATTEPDSSASGGSIVRFNNDPDIHISNGNLVNSYGKTVRLLGVDISGTEDACIQNQGFSWGASSTQTEDNISAAALLSWHVNTVRIPLNEDCWLGINGAPAAYSGSNYQTMLKNWVTTLNNAGITTILDLHWAAPSTYTANQQWPMANADHTLTFWSQVAAAYKNDPAVIYDPFNEPFLSTSPLPGWTPSMADWGCWLNGCSLTVSLNVGLNDPSNTTVTYQTAGMQQLVNTIRAAGANQIIMLGGLNWAGDPCGLRNSNGNSGSCSEIANMPTDPANQLAISFHTYNWTSCITTSCWNTVESAAKAANIPIITGEVGERDCTTNFVDNYTNWADQNNVSYLAWSWEVNNQSSCNSTTYSGSLQLLSNYNGTPSTAYSVSSDYKSHLITENP